MGSPDAEENAGLLPESAGMGTELPVGINPCALLQKRLIRAGKRKVRNTGSHNR